MVDFEELKNKIHSDLDKFDSKIHQITETPYAWIFHHIPKVFTMFPLGNSPIIVNKKTGLEHVYSSAYSIESMLEMYEEDFQIYGLKLKQFESLSLKLMLLLKKMIPLTHTEIVLLKNQSELYIAKSSEKKLLKLQQKCFEANIQTEIVLI